MITCCVLLGICNLEVESASDPNSLPNSVAGGSSETPPEPEEFH